MAPGERAVKRARRKQARREKKEALGKFPYWLRYSLPWWLIGPVICYVGSVLAVGGTKSWELLSGLTSPHGMKWPLFTWSLSVFGWVLIPALIGILAGYLVSAQIDKRRSDDNQAIWDRLRQLADQQSPSDGGGEGN
ncbi:DUF6313 family protein [Streptomyces massasporeus]|uniref:DUF6313 family protein n=1 Tax=Streptomyces massasporeus TaxID=67324 RepID=UPI0033C6BD65